MSPVSRVSKKIIGQLSRRRKFIDIYCTFKHCNALPIAVKYAIKIGSGTRELSHEMMICKSLPNSVKLINYNYNTITTSVMLSACNDINELHYTVLIKRYPYFKVCHSSPSSKIIIDWLITPIRSGCLPHVI